jgi:hypothetical protein
MAKSTGPSRSEQLHRLAAWKQPVTLRLAGAADVAALDSLAQRDSRPLPPGPHLLGERGGRVDAAISLATGELVSDPFRRTAELCELLRCHAGGARTQPQRTPAPPFAARPRLVAA